MREVTKEVKHEIDGTEYTFQIHKMNALKGTYLAKFAAEKLIPVFSRLQGVFTPGSESADQEKVIAERTEEILAMIPDALSKLSNEEVEQLLSRCLNTVDVLLPAGWQPVMAGNDFGFEGLEYDIMTALILCYEVIEFNLGGFFGGKSLASILPGRNTSPRNA